LNAIKFLFCTPATSRSPGRSAVEHTTAWSITGVGVMLLLVGAFIAFLAALSPRSIYEEIPRMVYTALLIAAGIAVIWLGIRSMRRAEGGASPSQT